MREPFINYVRSPCHNISPVVFGAVCFVLIWWLSAFFRLYKYCKGSQGMTGGGGEPASNYVAVSNHLFKVDNTCDVRS